MNNTNTQKHADALDVAARIDNMRPSTKGDVLALLKRIASLEIRVAGLLADARLEVQSASDHRKAVAHGGS